MSQSPDPTSARACFEERIAKEKEVLVMLRQQVASEEGECKRLSDDVEKLMRSVDNRKQRLHAVCFAAEKAQRMSHTSRTTRSHIQEQHTTLQDPARTTTTHLNTVQAKHATMLSDASSRLSQKIKQVLAENNSAPALSPSYLAWVEA